jgi:hypothetical protein
MISTMMISIDSSEVHALIPSDNAQLPNVVLHNSCYHLARWNCLWRFHQIPHNFKMSIFSRKLQRGMVSTIDLLQVAMHHSSSIDTLLNHSHFKWTLSEGFLLTVMGERFINSCIQRLIGQVNGRHFSPFSLALDIIGTRPLNTCNLPMATGFIEQGIFHSICPFKAQFES